MVTMDFEDILYWLAENPKRVLLLVLGVIILGLVVRVLEVVPA